MIKFKKLYREYVIIYHRIYRKEKAIIKDKIPNYIINGIERELEYESDHIFFYNIICRDELNNIGVKSIEDCSTEDNIYKICMKKIDKTIEEIHRFYKNRGQDYHKIFKYAVQNDDLPHEGHKLYKFLILMMEEKDPELRKEYEKIPHWTWDKFMVSDKGIMYYYIINNFTEDLLKQKKYRDFYKEINENLEEIPRIHRLKWIKDKIL